MTRFFTLLCFVLISQSVLAQTYSFEDLTNFQLLDAGAITTKNEVSGYYLFFEKDKRSKDSSDFIVKILDQNLNELTNKELRSGPNTQIESLVFNGRSILLKQYERDGKDLSFQVQNMKVNGELNLLGEQELEIHKHTSSKLYAVPDRGFVNIYGNKKRKAIVEFYTQDGQEWRYETPDNVQWEEFDYVTRYENNFIFSVYRYNKVTSGGDYYLVAIDEDSGQVQFEQVLTDFGHDHKIVEGSIDKLQEQMVFAGHYFDKGDDEDASNTNGIFVMKVSPDGDILDTDYMPWDGKISRYTKQYKKGKIKDGNLYMHDFIFLNDGKVFGIGEQYRKSFRPLGVAETALTLGLYGRLSQIDIGDIMVFRFGENVRLLDTERERKRPKKEYSHKGLYGGVFIPAKGMGEVMKNQNSFDFSHVSVDNEYESFTVFYHEKENFSKKQQKRFNRGNRHILRTITYRDKEYTEDKFYLTDGKGESFINILPAKPGYVLVNEMSDEYRGLRLEKIK